MFETIVKKKAKVLFWTSRQIVIYKDGSFAYAYKGNKSFKKRVLPSEISRIEHNKSTLVLYTNFNDLTQDNQLTFKFKSQAEARQWQIAFNAFC